MHKKAPFLFHTSSGAPLSTFHPAFYLDNRVADSVSASISEFGGLLTPILTETCVHLMPFPPRYYVPEIIHHAVYSYLYVVDSARLLELQSLRDYQLTTQPSVQRQVHGRNAYTYEEERRIYEYVKDHSKEGIKGLPYWVKAREELGNKHPPESMRFHYKHFTSKMDFSEGRVRWQAHMPSSPAQEEEEDERVKITVWPQKKVQLPSSLKRANPTKCPSPPHKSLKAETPPHKSLKAETPPQSPISSIEPAKDSPQRDIISSLSQLSLSSALAEPSYGEEDSLATFNRLVQVCQVRAQSQLLEREVLRALVNFRGDVRATVQFYSPPEA
jgi:hypothetical protein